MTLLKDLGYTNLEGTVVRKRHYAIVQCTKCNKEFTIILNNHDLTKDCIHCERIKVNEDKRNKILSDKEKVCSVCKNKLSLEKFGKHNGTALGYRSACKSCETEQSKEYKQQYTKNNKENKAIYDKQYRKQKHRQEKNNENSKNWVRKNKEKRKAILKNNKHKRRFKEKESTLTGTELLNWTINQPHICAYCGSICSTNYHIDHIEPLSKEGIHELDNLALSCPSCNLRKSDKPLLIWMAEFKHN